MEGNPVKRLLAGSELLAFLLVGVGHGAGLPAPTGVAISTRVSTTDEDERVLDRVADHLGRLRRRGGLLERR
jgi:hypothetical protein